MFVLAGTKLLKSLLIGHNPDEQMVAFLGGLPGAGKSRVIGALQELAKRWSTPEAVATAAYQGVAAQAANGQTIHKQFGWFVNSKRKWTPTQAQREQFAPVNLLILGEVSTCDVQILGMVDSSLRRILDRPSQGFGGVHVLLVGDWPQQLPVAGQPAYLTARPEAYQALTAVVILNENMRHQHDQLWRSILDKWRIGNYEQADVDLVNKIAYGENWTSSQSELKGYCPIIVTSNALRVKFNSSALRAFCSETVVPLHRFPAAVSRPRQPISAAQRNSLECTKNVSAKLKLANGSIGIVVSITTAVDDAIRVQAVDGVEYHTHSHPPEVVFVPLRAFPSQVFLPGYPPGVVPLCKRTEKSVTIKMAHQSFSVSITQVPIVSAYSVTTEKCQGLTVDKMVLGPLRHQSRRVPQRSSFYVAVTRVKSLRQLYLMTPLSLAYLSYFTPLGHALQETHRLESKEDEGSN